MRLVAALAVAALGVAAAPAAADEVLGSWTFRTGPYGGDCRQSGQMSIRPGTAANEYACVFTTRESCPGAEAFAEVEQTCTALREGDELVIISEIKRIAEQRPGPYPYAPDGWRLTVRSASVMEGALESAHTAPARFERQDVPVS